jgi:hypothetical protein
MSIVIKFILGLFISYEFILVFTRKHSAVSQSLLLIKENDYTFNPMLYGFDIALGLQKASYSREPSN